MPIPALQMITIVATHIFEIRKTHHQTTQEFKILYIHTKCSMRL